MKKLLSVVLALVMVLALCACGAQDSIVNNGGNETTEPTETTVHTHIFSDATCLSPATCSCGETEGEVGDHLFSDATCEEPMTCQECGAIEGVALGHTYSDATCVEPASCAICGASGSSLAPHSYVDGNCSVCGDLDPDYSFEIEE